MEKSCPLDKPVCTSKCAWYMDGKCAIVVVAEKLLTLFTVKSKPPEK